MPSSTSKATHSRLLDVAIDHFGRFGIDGASTRAIARDAETPMSSITYHFGGKEGLYLATASHIAERMGRLLAPAIAKAAATCQPGCTPEQAREALHAVYGHAAAVLGSAETAPLARFIVREQANPTEAFNRIYDGLMAPMLSRLAFLLVAASGGALDEQEARIRAVTLMGQVLVFRVARAAALRAGGWEDIGARELKIVREVLADHLDAILDRLAKRKES
jgi:TetR/AcrR family transcriptional regulator, regulator of cefoperazone and chloramphenicol sensitivity